MSKKVLVGITASYDSMATLILLKLQNFEIKALHVVLKDEQPDLDINSENIKCHNQTDEELMQDLCSALNIPLFFVDQKEIFYDQVVEQNVMASFMKEYLTSCTQCHKIKVNAIYQKMLQLGCENIATGHYAKLRKAGREGLASLYQYPDPKLDQHHLLAQVDQNILTKLLLPLGDLTREKVFSIVKEHLPKFCDQLSAAGVTKSCKVLRSPQELIKKNIASSLIRKARLCMREKNTYLNESYDNTEFDFGQTFKLGFDKKGKDNALVVTGYNYSYQTIYVSEDLTQGANYFFVQILEYFGEPYLHSPSQSKILINDDNEVRDATVYFKGLNYALVVLKDDHHQFVPSKSMMTILEDTRLGRKLNFLARIISQGMVDDSEGLPPMVLGKIKEDYPH